MVSSLCGATDLRLAPTPRYPPAESRRQRLHRSYQESRAPLAAWSVPGTWRQGASGSASVSSISWHQVKAALTARGAWRGRRPTRARAAPWPVPYPRFRSSARPAAMVETPPRMRLTASVPSGPGAAGGGGGRVQAQRLLSLTHQCRQIGFVADWEAAFGQDDLSGALDQFLRASDSQGRIVGDSALDAVQLFPDRAGILQAGQRVRGKLGPGRYDMAGRRIGDITVSAQRVTQLLGVLGLEAVHQPLEHP